MPLPKPLSHLFHLQAQERGQLLQLQDDATYALDGLRPGAEAAEVREAAAALAALLSTPAGRAALRCVRIGTWMHAAVPPSQHV